MKTKIEKATPAERLAWMQKGELYPLYGYVIVDGQRLVVEDLRGCRESHDPTYEVHAPDGKHFVGGLHTLLCYGIKDVKESVEGEMPIVPCASECG